MTPLQLLDLSRKRYNAVGDNFFSDDELLNSIYEASIELALEAQCIYKVQTTTTVASQREYELPSQLIRPYRIVVDGLRLEQIDFIEDDAITGGDEDITLTGEVQNFTIFDDTLYLRPIPDTSGLTIKIYGIYEPQEVTSSSTLEIPTRYHMMLLDYLLFSMFAKDKNHQMADYHLQKWKDSVQKAKAWEIKAQTSDSYKVIKSYEDIPIYGVDIE